MTDHAAHLDYSAYCRLCADEGREVLAEVERDRAAARLAAAYGTGEQR